MGEESRDNFDYIPFSRYELERISDTGNESCRAILLCLKNDKVYEWLSEAAEKMSCG